MIPVGSSTILNKLRRKEEQLARIDDYKESFRLAAEQLKNANLHRLAKLSGAKIDLNDAKVELRLPFFGVPHVVEVGEPVDVRREAPESEVPLPEKIVISHYLLHASNEPASGELITFRQIADGHFYFDAFQRRARDPFLATFGHNPELFRTCGEMLGAKSVPAGDVGMVFQVLPRIDIQLVLWQGDDEFPPEASILFDASIQNRLPVEDVAVVSGMLVYRLIGLARNQQT